MTSSVIGALRVNLGLDSAKFQSGVKALDRPMDRMKRNFARVGAAAVALGTALGGLTASVSGTAVEIKNLAQVANTTPQVLQGWSAATETVGISSEKLADILKDVNDKVGDFMATGGGPMADFFENIAPKVGVTADQFKRLSGPQALQLYVSSLEKANLSQSDMTFYMEAIASDATALLPLLRDNGLEMGRLGDQAARLGLVLDQDAISSLTKANLALKDAQNAFTGLGRQIAATFAPAMQVVAEKVANSVAGLSMLVRALRASGGAMAVLKNVAIDVFERIRMAFRTVPVAVSVGSNAMTEFFLAGLAKMAQAFVDFTADIADGLNALFGTNLTPLGGSMATSIEQTAEAAGRASAAARAEMEKLTSSIAAPLQSIEDFKETLYASTSAADEAATASENLASSLGGVEEAAGGGGAAGALAKTAEQANKTADEFRNNLQGGVRGVADAFAEWTVNGFKDFKSMTESIIDAFKRMIAQMIATAAANRIMIGLGFGGSVAGSAASAATGAVGAGGLLAGVGGLSGLGSAFMGGASFLGSGIASGFAAGGLGGAISGGASAFATAMSGATMGLGGAAAALGAAVPVIGALALGVMAFRTKTKTLDAGISVAIDGLDTSVKNFEKIQKSRFFGLSKKTSTNETLDADSPIIGAVNDIQSSVIEAARVLGVGADAFKGFSYDFKLSLKGLTDEEKLAKVNEKLAEMGDEFASLAPNIDSLNQLLEQSNAVGERIRALTDRQGLFATSADAVFAASAQGRQAQLTSEQTAAGKLDEILSAIIAGDINNARLTSQLVAIQQREALEPTS